MTRTQTNGKHNLFLFLLLLFINSSANGQTNIFYSTDSILKTSGYLAALDSLRVKYTDVVSDTSSSQFEISIANQAMMTYHSFIANTDSALYYEQKAHENSFRYDPLKNKKGFNHVPANVFIANNCSHARVLLFNENHNRTHTRQYLLELLPQLKKLGFTTLALEDLRESDKSLKKRGYPIFSSGFYVKEPVFAELVREAIRLGFTLLPYEQPGASDRGTASGEYLSKYLMDNPSEKEC